jgi:paraquat-inducible protein A
MTMLVRATELDPQPQPPRLQLALTTAGDWLAWRSIGGRIGLVGMIAAAGWCLYLGLTEPIIKLTQLYMFSDEHSLVSAVYALYLDGEYPLAGVILVFSILMPCLKLLYLLALAAWPLTPLASWRLSLARIEWLGKWSMHDVLILALTIVYLKAEGVSQAASLPGIRWFAVSIILIMIAYGWARRLARSRAGHAHEEITLTTMALRQPSDNPQMSGLRRFGVALLTLAAAVALMQGVTLPAIQLTKMYVWTDEHSIFSAIAALFSEHEYFLAGLIFLFSICVPILKLMYLLVVATLVPARPLARAKMLERLESLGKWSMMDVLVLALVIFYVNASFVADATALPGVYWFAVSVFLTMGAYALAKSGLGMGLGTTGSGKGVSGGLASIVLGRHNAGEKESSGRTGTETAP